MKKLIHLIPIVLLLIASNFPFVNTQSSHDTGTSNVAVINTNSTQNLISASSLNEIAPVAKQSLTVKFTTNEVQPAEIIPAIDVQIDEEKLITEDVSELWEAEAEADIETENWMSTPEEWLANK